MDRGKETTVDALMNQMQSHIKKHKNIRYFLAEFLGSVFYTFFSLGIVAQIILANAPDILDRYRASIIPIFRTGMLTNALAHGFAYALSLSFVGTVTTGHINPAVTFAAALADLAPKIWRRVPYYLLAQYLGACIGAALFYSVHSENLRGEIGEDRKFAQLRIFGAYQMPPNTNLRGIIYMWDETFSSALMVIVFLAAYDPKGFVSRKNYKSFAPYFAGAGLTLVMLTNGIISGASVNPARDFASRVLAGMFLGTAAWTGPEKEPNEPDSLLFFWIPMMLPFLGTLFGTFLYTVAVALHKLPSDYKAAGGKQPLPVVNALTEKVQLIYVTLYEFHKRMSSAGGTTHSMTQYRN